MSKNVSFIVTQNFMDVICGLGCFLLVFLDAMVVCPSSNLVSCFQPLRTVCFTIERRFGCPLFLPCGHWPSGLKSTLAAECIILLLSFDVSCSILLGISNILIYQHT